MAKTKKGTKKTTKKKVVTKKAATKKVVKKKGANTPVQTQKDTLFESYQINCEGIPLDIKILKRVSSYVKEYDLSIPTIGSHTQIILEKIRHQLVQNVNLGIADIQNIKQQSEHIQAEFSDSIKLLVNNYFPSVDDETKKYFVSYVMLRSIGLGEIDILMSDDRLEEIAINGAKKAIWVYHRKWGWLKTNVEIESDDKIRYYASTIGRKVGRQISTLDPLLDVTINVGDRVNATLEPISNEGNTITIRKYSPDPWTISSFLEFNTLSYEAAALLWHAIQYELSILIAGGTASGKTSMLNILANFFQPDHRVISIEDTRELKLPDFMHWIPMLTRLPNPEGKGEVTMLHLLQNSLRQRPDKIIVGEIRRPREAEVLFEAIHTGHSVYATFHANNAKETLTRLTHQPINVPRTMMPALSLIVVQYRNRRTGKRRTFQIAEINEDGTHTVLFQYDPHKDKLKKVAKSKTFLGTIKEFTGETDSQVNAEIVKKEKVLKWMVDNKITSVDEVSRIIAEFYTNPSELMKRVK